MAAAAELSPPPSWGAGLGESVGGVEGAAVVVGGAGCGCRGADCGCRGADWGGGRGEGAVELDEDMKNEKQKIISKDLCIILEPKLRPKPPRF